MASLADELARAKLEKSEAEGKNAMLEKMVELHKEVGSSLLEGERKKGEGNCAEYADGEAAVTCPSLACAQCAGVHIC